jgi:hypothetical protein
MAQKIYPTPRVVAGGNAWTFQSHDRGALLDGTRNDRSRWQIFPLWVFQSAMFVKAACASEQRLPSTHPLASQPLPAFVTAPDQTDYLLIATSAIILVSVFLFGLVYLRLHHLPDHIAHKSKKIQFEIVAVLGLLAMFTHVNAFWIAALLLALIDVPDFTTPLRRIAVALAAMLARRQRQATLPRGFRHGQKNGQGAER